MNKYIDADEKGGRMSRKEHTIYSVDVETRDGALIDIEWVADCGFGRYLIYKTADGRMVAESECMDRGEDKTFLKSLLEKFIDEIEIIE